MSSGADLFVVCKQCGSEVSPYITECPYCGHRLRRRAPKLPREGLRSRVRRPLGVGGGRSLRHAVRSAARRSAIGAAERPYATIALVLASCAVWVAAHAGPLDARRADGHRSPARRLVAALHLASSPTSTASTRSFTLVAVALFGWLLERRHGPLVVLGAVLRAPGSRARWPSVALYALPRRERRQRGRSGAAGAPGRCPTSRTRRGPRYYDGDLLGVAAIAAVLLAMPLARPEVELAGGCHRRGARLGCSGWCWATRAQP